MEKSGLGQSTYLPRAMWGLPPNPCMAEARHEMETVIVLSYNLGGMGCSAGLISIDLAKHLLQEHPNTYALVVSTENITLNWYFGSKRSMLVSNCLFRMGAGAILLSNRPSDAKHAKYQLNHLVRTHKANEDRGYYCAFQEEDARKEKEAEAADGGWTVVGQHKGRKKTTDAKSGTTMGSVALAVVLEKMGKKKSNDVGLNFYKFQRKEAQRNVKTKP
ncbi:hypothetical protein IFM89_007620 [Coptis chinensis]|uniref:FAE domain-containing protein n=1 Tax=Coptis chinensis TaxID=261450 RepID=A0A835LDU2_9MAGN|nr:hypothetical protein IFM89_007620 [Coptis chinensis]